MPEQQPEFELPAPTPPAAADPAGAVLADAPLPARPPIYRGVALREGNYAYQKGIEQKERLSPFAASILSARGHKADAELSRFLGPKLENFPDIVGLRNVLSAADRLIAAVRRGETIGICCDADVDGITSGAQLVHLLRELGVHAVVAMPNRELEGHQLSTRIARHMRDKGVTLLFALDLGSRSFAELELLRGWGIATVVVDHHVVGDQVPKPDLLVNPSQPGCNFAANKLPASGLTWCLVSAVARRCKLSSDLPEIDPRKYLDLAALGVVCDVASFRSPVNRILVAEGLALMNSAPRAGIDALRREAEIREALTAQDIGFQLGPRINSAGRLGKPELGLDLLTSSDREHTREIAKSLSELNDQRRTLENETVASVEQRLARMSELPPLIAIEGENYNLEVIGLAAQRIAAKYFRPVAIIGRDADGNWRGSMRNGVEKFNVATALEACGPHLVVYGGHQGAGGFTVAPGKLEIVRDTLRAEHLRQVGPEAIEPVVHADIEVKLSYLTLTRVRQMYRIGPFGAEHELPRLLIRALAVDSVQLLGDDHLSLRLSDGQHEMQAVFWKHAAHPAIEAGNRIDVVAMPFVHRWAGKEEIRLDIVAAESSGVTDVVPMRSLRPDRTRPREQVLMDLGDGRRIALPYKNPPARREPAAYEEGPSQAILDLSSPKMETQDDPDEWEPAKTSAELKTRIGGKYLDPNALFPISERMSFIELFVSSGENMILKAATGSGKTFTAATIIDALISRGERGFLITPQEALAHQTLRNIQMVLPDLPDSAAAIVTGNLTPAKRREVYIDLNAKLVIATPQVIENDVINGKLFMQFFDFMVIDEFQQVRGKHSSVQVLRWAREKGLHSLGLSAWPTRNDAHWDFQKQTLGAEVIHEMAKHERFRYQERFFLPLDEELAKAVGHLRDLGGELVLKLSRELEPFEGLSRELHRISGCHGSAYRMPTAKQLKHLRQGIDEAMPGNSSARYTAAKLNHLQYLSTTLANVGRECFLDFAAPKLWDAKFSAKSSPMIRSIYRDPRVEAAFAIVAGESPYHLLSEAKSPSLLVREVMSTWSERRSAPVEEIRDRFMEIGYSYMVASDAPDHPKEAQLDALLRGHLENSPGARHLVFTGLAHSAQFLCDRINHRLVSEGQAPRAVFAAGSQHMSAKRLRETLASIARGEADVLCATSILEEGLEVKRGDFGYFYSQALEPQAQLQREGRVGRGDATGVIYHLITENEHDAILHFAGRAERRTASKRLPFVHSDKWREKVQIA